MQESWYFIQFKMPQKYEVVQAMWTKLVRKDHILYDTIYMKCRTELECGLVFAMGWAEGNGG